VRQGFESMTDEELDELFGRAAMTVRGRRQRID